MTPLPWGLPGPDMRLANIATGAFLLALAATILFGALDLVAGTLERGLPWYHSSGIFPAFLALALAFCALKLMAENSRRKDAPAASPGSGWHSAKMACGIFAWLAFYMFVLLPGISYFAATAIFASGLIVFGVRKLVVPLLAGTATSAVLYLIFAKAAFLPLP